MPTIGSITKTVRINAESRRYLERIMEENGLTWSGAVNYVCGVVENRQDLMDKAVEREIKGKCEENGISTHDFFRGINELWKKKKLEIDGYKVVSLGDYELHAFEEACYILNCHPQNVIDRMTAKLKVDN